MIKTINLSVVVPLQYAGKRLDQTIAQLFPDYSRECLKNWIKIGACLVNGTKWQPKMKVTGGENIEIIAKLKATNTWEPQNLFPLESYIVYEDTDLIVINKPINCVVHPGHGNSNNTLVNALLYYAPELSNIPRAGIVHRLDKDTSGLMVVAKTITAHASLVAQLKNKLVTRTYEAIVSGVLIAGGTIKQPIGRHAKDRLKMAVTSAGKQAITHYRVIERFRGHTHIKVQLETGRTHQIRVHMAYIKHHIIGDNVYKDRTLIPKGASQELISALRNFPRQALHSKVLGLQHPTTQKLIKWETNLPEDMQQLLGQLRSDIKQGNR